MNVITYTFPNLVEKLQDGTVLVCREYSYQGIRNDNNDGNNNENFYH